MTNKAYESSVFLKRTYSSFILFSVSETAYTLLSFIYSQTYRRLNRFQNEDLFINEIYKWLFWAQITDEVSPTLLFSVWPRLLALPTFCCNGSGTLIPDNFCAYIDDFYNTRQKLSFEWTIDLSSSFSTPFFFHNFQG